ncbi:MAG: phospholipid carrier-dependent glycosyltransferase, partial [Anaerolineales bacterium]|nr:phospholipid carrier-dependent glycosyltransferase [Anaerolineales bacterium]
MPTLPPGLNFDEAGSGVAALEILSGAPKIWWRLGGGQEPLWPYLAALSTAFMGNIPLALRLPAALIGILTVAAVYPLLLILRLGNRRETHFIALLTALSLTLSEWHLHFSRLGFRAILLPLLSTLAFYFLWRGLISSQNSDFTHHASRITLLTLAALFTALAMYSYLAARLLPLVPLLYWVLLWLLKKIKQRSIPPSIEPQKKNHRFSLSLLPTPYSLLPTPYFLLLLLFLSPLILYFSLNPADFVARSTTVSVFNPAWNQGNLGGTLWQTLTATLGTFLGLTGDPNPLVNLPRPTRCPAVSGSFFSASACSSASIEFSPLPPCP